MDTRYASSPKDAKYYTTQKLREEYLINNLFEPAKIHMVYSHFDRIITGGVMPLDIPVSLPDGSELHTDFFMQRRELGIINIGGAGSIVVDGVAYHLETKDGMYIGMGAREVTFLSDTKECPAKFYLNSTPAHKKYPTVLIKLWGEAKEGVVIVKDENKVELGCLEESNHRVINKYILPGQVDSCQLVMGMTSLKPGSVWNTMPCHTHDRRMEVYLYFELPEDAFVMHYMGEADETRHIVVRNEQAVISPSWSIHAGCGSIAYTFIWGMAGENQIFSDMDNKDNADLM